MTIQPFCTLKKTGLPDILILFSLTMIRMSGSLPGTGNIKMLRISPLPITRYQCGFFKKILSVSLPQGGCHKRAEDLDCIPEKTLYFF
jgi:hypothetical protein